MYFVRKFSKDLCEDDNFDTTYGAKSMCTTSSFKVFDRTSEFHGVSLDLKNFRHCMESTRTYLLTVRLSLTKSQQDSGTPTECASSGQNCLIVQHEHMDDQDKVHKDIIWEESQALATKYGEHITIAKRINFKDHQLIETNVYQLIKLFRRGSPSETSENLVDIDIEEFNLYLPPRDLYPSNDGHTCSKLEPLSADAETGGYSPFPFYPSDNWLSITIEEDTRDQETINHFFKIRGRSERDRERVGLVWDLEKTCIEAGAYLRCVKRAFLLSSVCFALVLTVTYFPSFSTGSLPV